MITDKNTERSQRGLEHSFKKDPRVIGLKILLAERGLTHAELARRTHLSLSLVRKVCTGHNESSEARRKIEEVLGTPVWSSAVEFRARQ